MVILLLLIYAALCVSIFKVMRAPVNQWTVTTAVVGAIIIVGGILAGMNYNHPYTTNARLYFYTSPIVPIVSGPVVEVTAEPNKPIRQGDLLFRIDPRPYQFIVDQKQAALAEARQSVKQLDTGVRRAEAALGRVRAQEELAQQTYDRQAELLQRQVVSQAALDAAVRNLEAARQSVAGAEATLDSAQIAYASNIDGVNTTVARLEADLHAAEYNLSQTRVLAPTDGYVAQMLLRPGMTVSAATPTMVFIHRQDQVFVAAFPQTAIPRLQVGRPAEAAFAAAPGRVYAGRITVFANAIAAGQLQTTGTILDPVSRVGSAGDVTVTIDLGDDFKALNLPPGSAAQVAVYSDHWRPIAIVRRILLRMQSWLSYIA